MNVLILIYREIKKQKEHFRPMWTRNTHCHFEVEWTFVVGRKLTNKTQNCHLSNAFTFGHYDWSYQIGYNLTLWWAVIQAYLVLLQFLTRRKCYFCWKDFWLGFQRRCRCAMQHGVVPASRKSCPACAVCRGPARNSDIFVVKSLWRILSLFIKSF